MIPLYAGENSVGLLGDTHGNLAWEFDSAKKFADAGVRVVLHLGDFGIGYGDERVSKGHLLRLTRALEHLDQTWVITPGNHENWYRIAAKKQGAHGVLWFSDRVAVIPRGHRWSWGDPELVSFVSLGGAPSVDRADRTEGRDWWPAEQIADTNVAAVIADGPADVMLTHDAPSPGTPAVERHLRYNPQGWPPDALEYAAEGRARLTRAFHAVQPRLLVHGHMHIWDRTRVWLPDAIWDTEVVSLAGDGMPRNSAILDLTGGPHDLMVTVQ